MIQLFFDYVCNGWPPYLSKNLKTRLQVAQHKCIRFCLKLSARKSIIVKERKKINWLPIHKSVNSYTHCYIYKFDAMKPPDYLDEVFSHAECNGIPTHY